MDNYNKIIYTVNEIISFIPQEYINTHSLDLASNEEHRNFILQVLNFSRKSHPLGILRDLSARIWKGSLTFFDVNW